MATKDTKNGLRTWIEVDKKLLQHNYNVFRSAIEKDTKLMAVVKSNAYGHSLVDFSKEITSRGADWVGVDSIMEGLALRRNNIKTPILVLGHVLPEMVKEALNKNISLTVSNFTALKSIEKMKLRKPVKVHIKVDTGMHRQGFLPEQKKEVLSFLRKTKNIKVEGLYTHFADAKNPSFPKYTLSQIDVFKEWKNAFEEEGFDFISHACATSGTMLFPNAHFDMVRVGIGLYGLWPSKEAEAAKRRDFDLKPILIWKTVIGEVKTIPKGSKIGYNLTEEVSKRTRIAVCPVGYWHGYPRCLSGVGEVLVKGKRARVLGRISMDIMVIDASKVPNIAVGDDVVLLGESGKEKVSADNLAHLADTINYEIVTRINPLIKKFYV